MLTALASARLAGIEVPDDALAEGRRWVESTMDEDGRIGYVAAGTGPARPADLMDAFPPGNCESLTAAGNLVRLFTAEDPEAETSRKAFRKGVALCLAKPPRWEPGQVDMYYWYYATVLLHQVGGKGWKSGNRALEAALLPKQEKRGCAKGSWPPAGPWGREGGRVYSTALCAMMLETYYRHRRLTE